MFRNILVPVDLQETHFADRALEVAVEQARRHGGQIHVLTVLPGFGMPWVETYFPRASMDKAKADVDSRLQAYVRETVPGDVKVASYVAEGTPHREILQAAEELGADLIVLASHDARQFDKVLLGSTAAKVVEQAPMSVLVVRK